MQSFTTFESATGGRVSAFAQLEALKWLGLLAMLIDHANWYLWEGAYGWAYAVGRLAFPLFAIALASGLSDQNFRRGPQAIARLLAWGIVAQPLSMLVRDPASPYLNVLFTLAFGVALFAGFRLLTQAQSRAEYRAAPFAYAALCVAAVMVHRYIEFGVPGVIFVAVCCWLLQDRSRAAWAAFGIALVLLILPNRNAWALAVVPALFVLHGWQWQLPRVRHVFYITYAAQFPLFWMAHHVWR